MCEGGGHECIENLFLDNLMHGINIVGIDYCTRYINGMHRLRIEGLFSKRIETDGKILINHYKSVETDI